MSSMDAPARRDTPWTAVGGGTSLWPSVFGAALLCWSWWEASGSASLDDQTGWLVTAILGVAASGFGLVAWLRAGRRAVKRRRIGVIAALEELVGSGPAQPAEISDALVTYEGSTRSHRPGCVLLDGKGAYPVGAVTPSTVRACEICQP